MRERAPNMTFVADAPPAGEQLIASWRRSLLAANRPQTTIIKYTHSVRCFYRFLASNGLPCTRIQDMQREHIEAFMAYVVEHCAATSAKTFYASIHIFFAWLVEDGELERSPMERMHPPKVPERDTPVLPVEHVQRLMAACRGNHFVERRDLAILLMLADTGMRRGEIATLVVSDVDLDRGEVRVLGKGRKPRIAQFGRTTTKALDRYLRSRGQRDDADLPALWLGLKGPMTAAGIRFAVERRARQAGIGDIWPHMFRHTFADAYLAADGNESYLMELGGWSNVATMYRYGKVNRARRAREDYRKRSFVDSL